MNLMKVHKTLAAFASQDETRYHLTGVHCDGERFWSTCGHRLLSVKRDCVVIGDKLESGRTYSGEAFDLGMAHALDAGFKYPNCWQLVPDIARMNWTFRMVIPEWFSRAGKRHKKAAVLGIDREGNWTTGEALVRMNVQLLQELAGLEVDVHVTDATGPVVIVPVNATDTKSAEWFALVMPIRGPGGSDVKVIKQPVEQGKEALA